MPEDDLRTVHRPGSGQEPHQDFLAAENVSLRLLLEQAEINSRSLLAKAGIGTAARPTAWWAGRMPNFSEIDAHKRFAIIRQRARQPEPPGKRTSSLWRDVQVGT